MSKIFIFFTGSSIRVTVVSQGARRASGARRARAEVLRHEEALLGVHASGIFNVPRSPGTSSIVAEDGEAKVDHDACSSNCASGRE